MSEFNVFVDEVKAGAKDLAKQILGGYQENAVADTQAFLDKAKADLERWTKQLALTKLERFGWR